MDIRISLFAALCATLLAPAHAQHPPGLKELKIGDPAPDFKLIGIDDKTHALADFKDSKFLAVVFTSNHCPVSHAAEPRLIKKPVPVEITSPIGCSTKWRMKKSAVAKDDEKWASLPVAIELIDAAGVAKLRANPTDKFRLINIWSTTCAPCVEEFPGLVSVARRMGMRPFELVTISMDPQEDKAKAEAFLKERHAGLPGHLKAGLAKEGRTTNSYLYTEASMEPLIKALDPEWTGIQPHTLLIAPGGKIAFRHTGMIRHDQLLEKVLEVMTPFYQPAK